MENSEINDYLDTLDETVEGTVDESVGSLLGEESGLFVEEVVVPQAPVVSMDTLPITGEARVDDALGRLADLQGLPVHEHVDVFEDVQRRLHETLADLAGQ
jgi:poly-gamma-glutamate capsule biosynthesis protein CapA/YwtB (metallophosphatase superfamily)